MRNSVRSSFAVIAAAALAVLTAAASSTGAMAQAKQQAPAKQAAPAPTPAPAAKQIPLTQKQVKSVLASQKDFEAVGEQAPDKSGKPATNALAKLEDVAKKHGFASYADYSIVLDNIGLVLSGFDPKTKTYVGPEAVIKQQLAEVQADKKMPAPEKKDALADLNQALKALPPAVENKGNIDLVGKYYDQLSAAMQEDE